MKVILFSILIAFALSYNPSNAVAYALKYCKNYNNQYPNYRNMGGDCANFVSQCLIAGGMNFSGCQNVKSSGVIAGVTSLKNCLLKKGWHLSTTKPSSFKAGYPMVKPDYSHTIIATEIKSGTIYYSGHTNDVCNKQLGYSVYYLYP